MKKFSVVTLFTVLMSSSLAWATDYGATDSDWRVADNNPSGATLQFVESPLSGNSVLETSGSGHKNAYLVGGTTNSSGWNNSAETRISWRLKATESTSVYVRVETDQGRRWIRYNHSTNSTLLNTAGTVIHHGLGASYRDGQWNTWTRDLAADLAAAEPGNTLLNVNGVLIRGNVQFDRLSLTDSSMQPPVVNVASLPEQANLNDTLLLDGQSSTDPDGSVVSYIWRDADGDVLGTEASVEFIPTTVGTQSISLEITDNNGQTALKSFSMDVKDASVPTVYSDAEAGDESGWRVSDNNPSGAALQNIVDPMDVDNRVVEFTSSGTTNSFINGNTNPTRGWNNSLQKFVSWRSLASENFRVYVRVETLDGWRYLWYDNRDNDILHNRTGLYVHHGLGTEAANGTWQTFERDLEADLRDAEPDNTVLSVQAVVVRGSFLLDDLELRNSAAPPVEPPPPPVPVTPVNVSPAVDTNIEEGETVTFVWQAQPQMDNYDFHLFNKTDSSLTYVNALAASEYCAESSCSLELQIELPVSDDHAWRVRARNESGLSGWSRSEFNVVAVITEAPDAPTLTNLSNAAVFFTGDSVEFSWSPTEQTSSYEFAIVDTSSGATIDSQIIEPLDQCTSSECSYTTTVPGEANDSYVWQVRSINVIGASDWAASSFELIVPVTQAPPIPVNVSPAVGVKLVQGSSVSFTWQASDTASHYDFHFFDNVSKGLQYTYDLDADAVCADGLCSVDLDIDLPLFTGHAWRVRAANIVGNSGWTRSIFEVVDPSDLLPDVPVNVSPADAAVLIASTEQLFTWEPVEGATTYDFHLFDDLNGELPYILDLPAATVCDISSCSYTATLMDTVANGHAWRVRARNSEGVSDWSRSAFAIRNEATQAPVAEFSISSVFGESPLTIEVDASASSDDVGITNYQWDFGGERNLESETAITASHTFTEPGEYEVVLNVSDESELTDSSSIIVTVTQGLPPDAPSEEAAARLLAQASFGASGFSIQQVRQLGLEGWIDWQLGLQGPPHLDYVLQHSNGSNRHARHEAWWIDVVEGEDQLRQRVAYALSQLFVVSDTGYTLSNAQYGITNYYDLLRENAFGNYRELLESVTLNPVMAIYLSMLQNDKGSLENSTRADENYAREVLQLFSIGLHNLNLDGSLSGGNTFTQANIEDFARVFTGWNYKNAGRWDRPLFTNQDLINPMEPFEDHHDSDSKTLLLGEVSPAGLSAREDLEFALNNIFSHPNVAPFVSSHLIKQLVTSNPSPGYVERVSSVFNNNGNGVRGDLGATVKALLLDDEARNPGSLANFGKLREPVLRISHLWRAFNVIPGNRTARGEYNTNSPEMMNLETITGQAVLRSPSVFNFFDSHFSPSGPVRDEQMLAPEFQIFTDTNLLSTATRINDQIHKHYAQNPERVNLNPSHLDFSVEISKADDPDVLLDHLNVLLLSGGMSDSLRSILAAHLTTISDDDSGLVTRVLDAVSLIAASPEYLVQK